VRSGVSAERGPESGTGVRGLGSVNGRQRTGSVLTFATDGVSSNIRTHPCAQPRRHCGAPLLAGMPARCGWRLEPAVAGVLCAAPIQVNRLWDAARHDPTAMCRLATIVCGRHGRPGRAGVQHEGQATFLFLPNRTLRSPQSTLRNKRSHEIVASTLASGSVWPGAKSCKTHRPSEPLRNSSSCCWSGSISRYSFRDGRRR